MSKQPTSRDKKKKVTVKRRQIRVLEDSEAGKVAGGFTRTMFTQMCGK
jgi:hypothetical protein